MPKPALSPGVIASLAVAVYLTGCAECVIEGCNALHDRARGPGTGIGGVVASTSDVVENGCQQCGFSDVKLDVYTLTAATAASLDVVQSGTPVMTIAATQRYQQALDAGHYRVCAPDRCIDIVVEPGSITTVNIKKRYGPTSFFAVEPESGELVEDYGLARPDENAQSLGDENKCVPYADDCETGSYCQYLDGHTQCVPEGPHARDEACKDQRCQRGSVCMPASEFLGDVCQQPCLLTGEGGGCDLSRHTCFVAQDHEGKLLAFGVCRY